MSILVKTQTLTKCSGRIMKFVVAILVLDCALNVICMQVSWLEAILYKSDLIRRENAFLCTFFTALDIEQRCKINDDKCLLRVANEILTKSSKGMFAKMPHNKVLIRTFRRPIHLTTLSRSLTHRKTLGYSRP